jgi:hypothetical protein
MKLVTLAAAAACLLVPAVATAQETDDWEYGEDAGRKMTAAVSRYDSGHAFVVQCVDQALTVVIGGFPGPDQGRVWLSVVRADGRRDRLPWRRTAGGGLRAEVSGRSARLLRGGGAVQVRGGEASTPVRAAFELPSESQNLDKTLTACGTPEATDRDALPIFEGEVGAVNWNRATRNAMPAGAEGTVWARGSCLIQPGLTLGQCRVDERSANGERLAEGLVREMEGASVTPADGEAAAGKVEYFDFAIVQQISTSPVSR